MATDDIKLFEGNKIRSVWDNEKEERYFSVVDVVAALTESPNPRDYWYRVKKRMSEEEKSELSTICRQLKQRGGSIAGLARKEIEKETGKPVISPKNAIDFSHLIDGVIKELPDKDKNN